ncbi:MAG: hypothetical protein WC485_01040 [Opitutaceae bacterium]
MKPLLFCLTLLVVPVIGSHAEMFRPPIASGRGFHQSNRSHFSGIHGDPHAGRRYGSFRGGYGRWHDRDTFWGWGAGPGFFLGYGTGLFAADLWDADYGYYDGWPRYAGRLPYDAWPYYYEQVPATRYDPAAAPVLVSQPVMVPAGDGLRDARSPDQLRDIYGAQAEGLIRGN